VIDGFAWSSYIKKFEKMQYGRGPVLVLKRQCEGKISIKTCKNAAYVSIRQSKYRRAASEDVHVCSIRCNSSKRSQRVGGLW
jgi:hypothetical protein